MGDGEDGCVGEGVRRRITAPTVVERRRRVESATPMEKVRISCIHSDRL